MDDTRSIFKPFKYFQYNQIILLLILFSRFNTKRQEEKAWGWRRCELKWKDREVRLKPDQNTSDWSHKTFRLKNYILEYLFKRKVRKQSRIRVLKLKKCNKLTNLFFYWTFYISAHAFIRSLQVALRNALPKVDFLTKRIA